MAKTRECPECKRELELSEEFWLKNKSSKDGFRNPCKDCTNAKIRNDRIKNPDKYREQEAKWRKNNPEKLKIIKKKEYKKNSDKYKARTRKWHSENTERHAKYQHNRYMNKKEEIKEYNHNYYIENKDKILENVAIWVEENPEKFKAIQARRRDLKNNLDCELTSEDIIIIFEEFKNECFKCGTTEKLSIDHHYPLSKGYGLNILNAVILCKSCNSSKHNKMPEDFYDEDEIDKIKNIFLKIKERI